MAANTIMMYFKIPAAALDSLETWERLEGMGRLALGSVTGEPTVLPLGGSTNRLVVFEGPDGSHATLRIYHHGLATLDIQQYVSDTAHKDYSRDQYNIAGVKVNYMFAVSNSKAHLSEEYIRALEQRLRDHLAELCDESHSLYCPVRRGQTVWPYVITADERILELDTDNVVFEQDSDWQNIRIVHSKECGNTLYLDGDVMLAESDLIYTEALCCIGQDSYHNREVLILGGGDGGILHQLLKESPKFVLMAEIDEAVIKACRTHMRSVCGDCLDVYQGHNYKIMIEDCVTVLHDCIQSGRQFDFVINDLTEQPVEKEVRGFGYDFETSSLITEMSLRVVKPGGKLLSRGNCVTAVDYQARLSSDLRKLGCHFKRKDVYVPSFREIYSMYEIWKEEPNGTAENHEVEKSPLPPQM